jgi:hypothetical protein
MAVKSSVETWIAMGVSWRKKESFHSLTLVLANKRRKLVRTPGCRRFDQAAKVSAL